MNYLSLSNYTTSEVSDALDALKIQGQLFDFKPITSGMKLLGPAYTVQYQSYAKQPSEFKNAANYIDEVPAHSIVVIDNNALTTCTVWGDLLSEIAVIKKISGTLVNGLVRDVAAISSLNYPVFSLGRSMRSGKNRVRQVSNQIRLTLGEVMIDPGDIIFADDNGALVIPYPSLTEVLTLTAAIQETEAKIRCAIKGGMPLEKAREIYGYATPWKIN